MEFLFYKLLYWKTMYYRVAHTTFISRPKNNLRIIIWCFTKRILHEIGPRKCVLWIKFTLKRYAELELVIRCKSCEPPGDTKRKKKELKAFSLRISCDVLWLEKFASRSGSSFCKKKHNGSESIIATCMVTESKSFCYLKVILSCWKPCLGLHAKLQAPWVWIEAIVMSA